MHESMTLHIPRLSEQFALELKTQPKPNDNMTSTN